MSDAKEFHGKTLDEAILAACTFYGVKREKLEIEIVNDSKMGIFGLVNVKKACVRAALTSTPSLLEDLTETLNGSLNKTDQPKAKGKHPAGSQGKPGKGKPDKAPSTGSKSEGKNRKTQPETADAKNSSESSSVEKKTHQDPEKSVEASAAPRKEKSPRKNDQRAAHKNKNTERKGSTGKTALADIDDDAAAEGFSLADLQSFDQEELHSIIFDTVNRLVSSIIGEVPLSITIEDGHIRVKVDCDEDARILVGREGQTLASVQYIASRILAGKLNGAVRLHIDTGNYKENQDARLTSLAQMLAEKLRKTGRTQSTRPLSAYQRRIVHLALEAEEDIQTSSKGDGPQRRVLVHFKRTKTPRNEVAEAESPVVDGTDTD